MISEMKRATLTRWARRLALVLLLVPALALGGVALQARSAEQLNHRALELIEAGRHEEAIESLAQASRLRPSDPVLRTNQALAWNSWAVELAAAGQFPMALDRLRQARALAPDSELIRANLTTIRTNWATVLMEEKRHPEAERLLRQAMADAPADQRAEIERRLGYNAYLEARPLLASGQRDQGRRRLLQAIAHDPDSVHALIELARLDYEQGLTADALARWRRASQLDPKVQGLPEIISKAARELEVEAGFHQLTGPRFIISYADRAGEPLARAALKVLEQALVRISRELRTSARRPFAVVLYPPNQYRLATVAPEWSSGLYDGKIRIPLPAGPLDDPAREALATTLRHELTHAVVLELAGDGVPAWLNEGLANYFELEDAPRARRNDADRAELTTRAARGESLSLTNLPPDFIAIPDQRQVERAYLLSRAFVYWLAENGRPWKLRQLLEALGEGVDPDLALKRTYGHPLASLEQQWRITIR